MHIKHTFLFLLILGFAWVGILFAYSAGPDPGVNGIQGAGITCAQAGCHSGNPLNASGGSLTLSGLPAQWTPGTTYPLTVTVQRPPALNCAPTCKYGFQLSAVSTSINAQAGTLTATTNRAVVITGTIPGFGVVQFAEHNSIATSIQPFTGVFTVNWTAPASASAGTVRFNLAGNAANGDFNNTGDFIYTRTDTVPVAVAVTPQITSISTTPNPPMANQTFNFTLAGSNFDTTNALVEFNGPGCNACQGAVASRTATQITGTAALAAGNFTVDVRNGSGGTASNALSLAVSVIPFTLTDRQGVSLISDGNGNQSIGYARIQPNSGSTTPSGVAIFGLRQNNVLVTEAGVPASPLLTSGRIFAEVSGVQGTAGAVDTGFAIANPNNSAATVNFFFTDTNGVNRPANTFDIPANGQTVRFLNESPFNSGATFQGTFTFTSSVPVSVIAVRGFYNQRVTKSEFLITTLPVIDLSASAGSGTVYLAHFADGFADGV